MKQGWELEDYLRDLHCCSMSDIIIIDSNGLLEYKPDAGGLGYLVYNKLKNIRFELNNDLYKCKKAQKKLSKRWIKTKKTQQTLQQLEIRQKKLESALENIKNQIEFVASYCAKFYNYYYKPSFGYYLEPNEQVISANQAQHDRATEKIWNWFKDLYKERLEKYVEDSKLQQKKFEETQGKIEDILTK